MSKKTFKKCKNCGEKFTPKYNTLEVACSISCAIVLGKKKAKAKAEKEWKEEKAVIRKDITNWKNELQREV